MIPTIYLHILRIMIGTVHSRTRGHSALLLFRRYGGVEDNKHSGMGDNIHVSTDASGGSGKEAGEGGD